MKKRIFFQVFAMCIFACLQLSGRSVTMPEAEKAAGYIIHRQGLASFFSLKGTFLPVTSHTGRILLYVFPLHPEGFVVATAETELPPVLFYTFNGSFEDEAYGETFCNFLKADIAARMKASGLLPESGINRRNMAWHNILRDVYPETIFEQWPPSGTTPTGGWLMENWHQSAPYNNFCPVDPVTGNRSVAGCPATAMAMIVDHFERLNETTFTDDDDYYHNYAGRTYWIDDDYKEHDFLCFPDINDYFDTLSFRWAGNEPLNSSEKAALTFACGVAAKQVYTSTVSGTFGVTQAYNAYNRFGFSQCELLNDNDTSLYSKLSQNMKDGIPAHLAVVDPAWSMGHNVVVDGYNTDDFYHINFGWGGTYNGWYLIPDEIPYGLTVIEGVVLNIIEAITTSITGSLARPGLFTLYPNPANEYFYIDIDASAQQAATITILNIRGALIQQLEVKTPKTNKIRFDVGNRFTPGVYFCRVQSGTQDRSTKFIIQ